MTFEEYWASEGCRRDIADHKERARLAWEGCAKGYKEIYALIAPAKVPEHTREMADVFQTIDTICEERLEEK